MKPIHWLAAIVLGFELPVPIYWLILHTRIAFWRRHVRISYWIAVLTAWGIGDSLLYYFRRQLFVWPQPTLTPAFTVILSAGLALIAVDVFTLINVETELGRSRLVGHAELTASGDLATSGLYAWVRHPRYVGMIAAVFGVCTLLNSKPMWIVAFLWCILMLITMRLEERELRHRFGRLYREYSQRVPAIWPFHFPSRRGQD